LRVAALFRITFRCFIAVKSSTYRKIERQLRLAGGLTDLALLEISRDLAQMPASLFMQVRRCGVMFRAAQADVRVSLRLGSGMAQV